MNKVNIFLLVGPPGIGKSTWIKNYIDENYLDNCRVLSADNIRAELYGDAIIQGNPSDVFTIFFNRLHEAIFQKVENIFLDNTSLQRYFRLKYLLFINGICSAYNIKQSINLVYLDSDLELCLSRNNMRERKVPEAVIYRMVGSAEPPSESERVLYDNIIIVPKG